ncbi:MAG: hypothetical protein OEY59_06775, partial [Deltaproteobacteria bacterium]|nr:hypothetical protein [Deltaproteobacteria bacterium]
MTESRRFLISLLVVAAFYMADLFGLFEQLFTLDRAESISLSILLIAAFLWITEWVPLFIT